MFWHLDEIFPWEFVIREVSSLTPPYSEQKAGKVVITVPRFRGTKGQELGQSLVKLWNDALEGNSHTLAVCQPCHAEEHRELKRKFPLISRMRIKHSVPATRNRKKPPLGDK